MKPVGEGGEMGGLLSRMRNGLGWLDLVHVAHL